jgi:hypothetical protein
MCVGAAFKSIAEREARHNGMIRLCAVYCDVETPFVAFTG